MTQFNEHSDAMREAFRNEFGFDLDSDSNANGGIERGAIWGYRAAIAHERKLADELAAAIHMVVENSVQKTEGVYSPKNNKCRHDRYGYDGCEECICEYLAPLLSKHQAARGM